MLQNSPDERPTMAEVGETLSSLDEANFFCFLLKNQCDNNVFIVKAITYFIF